MSALEFDAPHHVTVGYVGRPGERVFYVQAEDDHARVALLIEKDQAEGIAELLDRLLARLDDAPATDWDRTAMQLREPVEAEWRVGEIAAGVDPENQRFVLELTEAAVSEDPDPAVLRVQLDRDQARRVAAHAREQVAQGRPRCPLCGRPSGADGGHVCPSTNGHGGLSS